MKLKKRQENAFNDEFSTKRGDFKIETVDALTGEILDVHEEHNLIMSGARNIISKLFAGVNGANLPNKFSLGTVGHKDGDITTPKDYDDGFTKDRNVLFSEVAVFAAAGQEIDINKNDIIEYTGSDSSFSGNYRFDGTTTINMTVDDVSILGNNFTYLYYSPQTYTTSFNISDSNTSSTNGSTVEVSLIGTSVTFKFELGTEVGNSETGVNMFTEAAIYAGDDIFCMKTFPAKIKDKTTIFRIFWTIVF